MKAKVSDYEAGLLAEGSNREGVIGVLFLVNGVPTGHEIYCSNALFRKAWPKLLRSASTEALLEKKDRPTQAPPSAREVERYLALAGKMEPTATMNQLSGDGQNGSSRSPRDFFIHERVSSGAGSISVNESAPRLINQNEIQRVGRVVIEGNSVTTDRVILNQVDIRPGQVLADILQSPITYERFSSSASPTSPQQHGNQLSVNKVENTTGLMTESRDPTRQNAVIHRSFIQKPNPTGR